MADTSSRFDPALTSLLSARYASELLLAKRLWLFLVADIVLIFQALLGALASGGEVGAMYQRVVILPQLLLGLPALSTVVALERRAGSLDLALAVPSTERYFVRRVVPVCGFLILQGSLLLILLVDPGWDLVRALVQNLETSVLLTVLTLFWAVRLKSSGAVAVASLISIALLSKWVFYSPAIGFFSADVPRVVGVPMPIAAWIWNAAVLAAAIFILLQYARRRLRRPEVMLA